MSEENMDVSPLFVELVFQLQGAAWIHMGKVANPGTGKIERNLEMARGAIDMLGMIEEKTRGNLNNDEERLLRELLSQVRLNFVSEQEKPDATAADAGATAEATAAEATAGEGNTTSDGSAAESSEASESNEASPDEEASKES